MVNCTVEPLYFLLSGLGEIFAPRGIDNAARRIDNHSPPPAIVACQNDSFKITALRTNTWNKNGHATNDTANPRKFVRICCSDNERAITVFLPSVSYGTREMAIKRLTVYHQILELSGPRV